MSFPPVQVIYLWYHPRLKPDNLADIIFVVPLLELPPPELICHPSFPPNNGQTSSQKSSDYTLLNPKKIILCFWSTVKEWEFVERHLISLQLVHQQWLLRYVLQRPRQEFESGGLEVLLILSPSVLFSTSSNSGGGGAKVPSAHPLTRSLYLGLGTM